MDSKYTIVNLAKEFRENKSLIEAYFKRQSVEGYNNDSGTIMGMGVAAFLIFFLIALSVWIWAVVALVKYWKVLPDWAKFIGLLALFPILPIGGPIVTLIVVYVAKPKSAYNFRHY